MKKDFIYLASASPRRRALLRQIGVRCRLRPADVDERRRPREPASAYVLRLAELKADAACVRLGACEQPVLAADTVVVVDGRPLGKPADERAVLRMLATFSNRTHQVMTAVAVRGGGRAESLISTSEVRIRATTAAERRAYCRSGEPLDKAGGYAIQGRAAVFIEHLSGSYSAVMGLPLFETAALLERFGVRTWLESDGAPTGDSP